MNNSDQQELKARSRISLNKTDTELSANQKPSVNKPSISHPKKNWKTWSRKDRTLTSTQSLDFSQYVSVELRKTRGVYLALTILLWLILAIIFTQVHPQEVANILLYQSYLPVLIIFAASIFMLGKFIFQRTHSSIIFMMFFTILLFFKLQQVALNIQLIGILLLILGAIEGIFRLVIRK